MKYRPEIDGLRTIAVLSVILYHANFDVFGGNPLKGGFLGVDIFFVISGFLITSILLNGFENNSLTLLNFYERRSRRILPILLFVMTASMPFFWMVLLPSDFQSYSWQLISGIFSVSNFYFWTEDSYWAADSILKPFLHTWSLGVEEQFYLFMPFLVIMMVHRNFTRPTLIFLTLALLSLIASHYISIRHAQSSFYLLPFRAWELLIGASIALMRDKDFSRVRPSFLPTIGLAIIFASFYFFDDETLHPSFYTLLPTIGVGLIIIFANEKDLTIKILRNKIMTSIGLISYGLYLWHFPVFSYLSHMGLFQNSDIKLGAIILVFSLSIFTFFVIEKPFRSFALIKSKTLWSVLVIWVSVLSLTAYWGTTDEFAQRYPEIINLPSEPGDSENHKWLSSTGNPNGNVILVGDSHIRALAPEFKKWAIDNNFNFAKSTLGGCIFLLNMNRVKKSNFQTNNCNISNQNDRLKFILDAPASIVLIGGRIQLIVEESMFNNMEGVDEGDWDYFLQNQHNNLKTIQARRDSIAKNYKLTINKILDAGHVVVLLYPVPEVAIHVPKKILEKIKGNIPSATEIITKNPITTDYEVYRKRVANSVHILDQIDSPKIYRIYPSEIFCNSDLNKRCVTHSDKVSYYLDGDHLSNFGAQLILEKFTTILSSENFKNTYSTP